MRDQIKSMNEELGQVYGGDVGIESGMHGASSEMSSAEIKKLRTEEIEKIMAEVRANLAALEKEIMERKASEEERDEEEGIIGHA